MNTWLVLGCLFSPVLSILAILLLARIFLQITTVQHGSMKPTLQPNDRVLVFRHWPARWLRKGQIVIIWPVQREGPYDSKHLIPYIKRVVGLPGDSVTLPRNEHHPDLITWQIPTGHFFVLADNLETTADSRLWGPVPFRGLLGVVITKLPNRTNKR